MLEDSTQARRAAARSTSVPLLIPALDDFKFIILRQVIQDVRNARVPNTCAFDWSARFHSTSTSLGRTKVLILVVVEVLEIRDSGKSANRQIVIGASVIGHVAIKKKVTTPG